MRAKEKNLEGYKEGVVYHENGRAFVITHCTICGNIKTSSIRKGVIMQPICWDCAMHTDEKRAAMSKTFKGRPKTPEQIEKLREASLKQEHVSRPCSEEAKKKISATLKGRPIAPDVMARRKANPYKPPPRSDEHRRHLSEFLKGRRPSDSTIEACIKAHKGVKQSQEVIDKRVESIKKYWKDPEWKENRCKIQKEACNTPEAKVNYSKSNQEMWDNRTEEEKAEFIKNVIKQSNRKPNKKELKLMALIDIACPNEYKYTGNGTFSIGAKIPDFCNVNGKKKVIEMFGDYFHSPDKFKGKVPIKWHRTEEGSKEIYKQYGFDCLVIWEKELKTTTDEELIQRIRGFTYGAR